MLGAGPKHAIPSQGAHGSPRRPMERMEKNYNGVQTVE